MSGQLTGGVVQTGSTADMVSRMRAVLPFAWFPASSASDTTSAAPVLDSILSGIGTAWSFCFDLLQYVRAQTRLATVDGCFLDLLAIDFFGETIRRRAGEADDTFRTRLTASLLLPRATRAALSNTLQQLIGIAPRIFEPRRSADTGGLGVAGFGYGALGPFQYLISLDANGGPLRRESQASYLDAFGRLQIAPRHAARPVYCNGAWQAFLVEPAGFNLLKNSVTWGGWSVAVSGAAARWAVNNKPAIALWSGQSVLEIVVEAAGSFAGPAVSVFVGNQSVSASAWIWLPFGHSLTDFHLGLGGQIAGQVVQADLTLVDCWQRLIVMLHGVADLQAQTVIAQLAGTGTAPMANKILTQCWQVEPGVVATSFIPSAGQIGVRDQDRVVFAAASDNPVVLDQTDIGEAIRRTIPAGSVAWLTLQHPQ